MFEVSRGFSFPSPIQIRRGLVLIGLLGGLVWLFHVNASNSVLPAKLVLPSPTPRQCPQCPTPSTRRIYAPAIDLDEAENCEIVLNSRSANPIDVTPTFYTARGDAIVGNPIQLQPAEIRFIQVEQLMPNSICGTHRWGGIALSYTGNVLEVWAQITFHGIGGGSIDETFNILEEPGSDTREAVWLMPQHSTAIVALGNSSSAVVHTNLQFSPGDCEDIEIPAGMTKFVRRHAQGNQTQTNSLKIVTTGEAGALRAAGFIIRDHDNFASSIRFYDTKKTIQPNLYGINLRLKNAMPRIALKNTSDGEITARPQFFTSKGEQDNPVELPNLGLAKPAVQKSTRANVSVHGARPMAKAVEVLEARCGCIITYEDPKYVYPGDITDVTTRVRRDLNNFKPGGAPKVFVPKDETLAIDYDELPASVPDDIALVVQKLIETHAAQGNAGRFRMEENNQAIHVIPSGFRNQQGDLTSQVSILDSAIAVPAVVSPATQRSGIQTLEAICAAITQATGMKTLVGSAPLNIFFKYHDRGARISGRARDVLMDLLKNADGKLSWQLLYDPGLMIYVLNVHQVPWQGGSVQRR